MRSLRQLREDLLGVRLAATNISTWQQEAVLVEYARVALNDAMAAFPSRIQMVKPNIAVNSGVAVLPTEVDEVIRIDSLAGGHPVPRWRLYPTATTTYLRLYGSVDGNLDVTYLYLQKELPPDLVVVTDGTTYLSVTCADSPVYRWPTTGFVELSESKADVVGDFREVVYYGAVYKSTTGGFEGLVREIEGYNGTWAGGTIVSPCWMGEDREVRPLILQAQAVMYEFFLRHRAMYEEYTAMTTMQALGLDDLQLLIRDLEERARAARREWITTRVVEREGTPFVAQRRTPPVEEVK